MLRFLIYFLFLIALIAIYEFLSQNIKIDQYYQLIKYKIPFFWSFKNETEIFFGNSSKLTKKSILILVWTKWYDAIKPNCSPDFHCVMTTDRQKLQESSAVIFLVSSLSDPLPDSRRDDQFYIFALWESPPNSPKLKENFFNLTMTYRLDSDIYSPYGTFRRRSSQGESKIDPSISAMIRGKSKLIAWWVSNCRTASRREIYVKRLSQFIRIDIYGKCGYLKCPRELEIAGNSTKKCDRMLKNEYKFYLSFENSLCRDYVTEKFYERLDSSWIVPIVLERKILLNLIRNDRETLEALNGSFIAADDFRNPQQLADYLKYLDKNITAYMKYFEWRRKFEVIRGENDFRWACELCRLVSSGKRRRVENLRKWWVNEAYCHSAIGNYLGP